MRAIRCPAIKQLPTMTNHTLTTKSARPGRSRLHRPPPISRGPRTRAPGNRQVQHKTASAAACPEAPHQRP
eukprot:892926-Alexandrium_andersonii.AAC.1